MERPRDRKKLVKRQEGLTFSIVQYLVLTQQGKNLQGTKWFGAGRGKKELGKVHTGSWGRILGSAVCLEKKLIRKPAGGREIAPAAKGPPGTERGSRQFLDTSSLGGVFSSKEEKNSRKGGEDAGE